ncbi:hypothetical protein TNCV_4433141 [Trichonephila clavipes]|nr:hypothetical protein TNCV_4433141 [Trichonephila clavipes]
MRNPSERETVDYSSDSSSEKSPADKKLSRSKNDSSAEEGHMYESRELKHRINSNFQTFLNLISSELTEGRTAISIEASRQEKSSFKPTRRVTPTLIKELRQEKSPCKPTRRITPTLIKEVRQEKSPCKPTRQVTPTLIKEVRQEKSLSEPKQSPITTVATNEEAVRESHGDALDIRERTLKKKKLSPFLPDPRDKRISKRREWSNDSFSGSVKDIKRVTRKIPRPSSNLAITTVEIHNEEGPLRIKPSESKKKIHVSKTGTGLFQFKNQPCIYYGPDTIEALKSIEIPEREPKKDKTSKIFQTILRT